MTVTTVGVVMTSQFESDPKLDLGAATDATEAMSDKGRNPALDLPSGCEVRRYRELAKADDALLHVLRTLGAMSEPDSDAAGAASDTACSAGGGAGGAACAGGAGAGGRGAGGQ